MRRATRILAPAAVAAAIVTGAAAPAVAKPVYPPAGPTGPTTTSVLGTTVTRTPTSPSSSQLPFTGEPILVYTVSGAALVLAGGMLTALVRRQRRRPAAL